MTKPISALRDMHKGQTAWVIGTGPSLSFLRREHFGDGPVIALYQATIVVEKLCLGNTIYSMQKDTCGFMPDGARRGTVPHIACDCWAKVRPQKASLLVHDAESLCCMEDYEPRYVWSNEKDFGISWCEFSSLTAIEIACLFGCNKIVYVSHDAFTNGNIQEHRIKSDGTFKDVPDPNYLLHIPRVKAHLEKKHITAEWLTPCA
jgi:hypothetical protein